MMQIKKDNVKNNFLNVEISILSILLTKEKSPALWMGIAECLNLFGCFMELKILNLQLKLSSLERELELKASMANYMPLFQKACIR